MVIPRFKGTTACKKSKNPLQLQGVFLLARSAGFEPTTF
jgi:hypothetical protein